MKSFRMINPKCQRCGYRYTGAGKAVLQFEAADGTYMACEDCLVELGEAETDGERWCLRSAE